MGKLIRNMVIGAAVFFVVGLALGLLMPAIANGLVATGLLHSTAGLIVKPIWEAAVFGVFGLLTPPVQKLISAVFGDDSAKAAQQQQRETRALEAACNELATRQQIIEQEVAQSPRSISDIIMRGPRASGSFAAAEETRTAGTSISTNLIH